MVSGKEDAMNNLRSKWMKAIITAALMLSAGLCYSCSHWEEGGFYGIMEQETLSLTDEELSGDGGSSGSSNSLGSGGSPEAGSAFSGSGSASGDGALSGNGSALGDGMSSGGGQAAGGDSTAGGGQAAGGNSSADGSSAENASQPAETKALCYVHICGAVNAPGVYELEEGSRVYQAVEAAGGFLPEADEGYLNLAALISDGMKITVLTREEAASAPAWEGEIGGTGQQEAAAPAKVNINTATQDQLMTLKGIGEARAADIIAYRQEHGPFRQIEDIMQVSGIKEAAFAKIKDDITV